MGIVLVDVIKNICKNDKIGGFSGIYERNGIKLSHQLMVLVLN